MATDDDAGTNVTQTKLVKSTLIAELTWAKLYTKVMHKTLDAISRTIRKIKPTAVESEMKKSAEKLHDQLQDANRTVGELSDHAGMRSSLSKDGQA